MKPGYSPFVPGVKHLRIGPNSTYQHTFCGLRAKYEEWSELTTNELDVVTCTGCLEAVVKFGIEAEQRLAKLERDNALIITPCDHRRSRRGDDVPRVYGSWRTEVCLDCGSFRTHGHDAFRSQKSEWRPAEEYAEATKRLELE